MKRKFETQPSEASNTEAVRVKVFSVPEIKSKGCGAEDCDYTPETLSDKFKRIVVLKIKTPVPSYIN